MIIVDQILAPQTLEMVADMLPQLRWEDGGKTAGSAAKAVKHNQQADLASRLGARLRTTLLDKIRGHPVVEAYARPLKFAPPLLSRTAEGETYGLHIDNPVMGTGSNRVRTDLSFTLFLSPPDAYEGGALEIETVSQTRSIKLAAGSLVLYPSTELHRVSPVLRGERLAFVGWMESAIRDAGQRALLFDIANLKTSLCERMGLNSPEVLMLSKTEANLIRMWTN